jgi:hypothetical protein
LASDTIRWFSEKVLSMKVGIPRRQIKYQKGNWTAQYLWNIPLCLHVYFLETTYLDVYDKQPARWDWIQIFQIGTLLYNMYLCTCITYINFLTKILRCRGLEFVLCLILKPWVTEEWMGKLSNYLKMLWFTCVYLKQTTKSNKVKVGLQPR